MSERHNTINYIEFPLVDAARTKAFYSRVFGWTFQEWGEHYLSFAGAGVDGGFNGTEGTGIKAPGVLVVLYSDDLEGSLRDIRAAGGRILREPYDFPGGRRFHFADPDGNELAIWTERPLEATAHAGG